MNTIVPPTKTIAESSLSQEEQVKRIMEFAKPDITKDLRNSEKRKKIKKKLIKLSNPRIIKKKEHSKKNEETPPPKNEDANGESDSISQEIEEKNR